MPVSEVAIWSAMLGGLLTLAGLALGDVIGLRTTAAWRNLMFVLVTGASCVVMTGLPEHFFPFLPGRVMLVLKASLGPLAGAMGLFFIGTWLGGSREDTKVHQLTAWGSAALVVAAVALAILATQVELAQGQRLLWAAATVNAVPVVLALMAVSRASRLGDPLAPWMMLAMVSLAIMVSGHYMHGLRVGAQSVGAQLFIAVATQVFFLIASVLGVVRNRQSRQLARLSRLEPGADPATGLHTGAALVTDIEHVFWRTARLNGQCTVVCLYVNNLYELTDPSGNGVEHQILATVAARIRRAAGFRCVVGLYHPRCFVVVIHTDQHQPPVEQTIERLRSMVGQPMVVLDRQQVRQVFRPHMGMAALTVDPTQVVPLEILNDAERQAVASLNEARPSRPAEIVTEPAPLA